MTAKNEVTNESVDNACTQASQYAIIHERRRRISGENNLRNEINTFYFQINSSMKIFTTNNHYKFFHNNQNDVDTY
jgi:hypothetical protein